MTPHPAALVILAGGRGRRLGGVVKPLLRGADGETILSTVERVLGDAVEDLFMVAPENLLATLAVGHRARPIADPGRGPAEALLVCAEVVTFPWLFVVGGDQPRPSRLLLDRLFLLAAPGLDAVRVEDAGGFAPFPALYRTAALRARGRARVQAEVRGLSMVALHEGLVETTVPWDALTPEERDAFLDIDTPEDRSKLGF